MDQLEKALGKLSELGNKQRYGQQGINYSQTKIHSIDHQTLRKNRVVSLEQHGIESETFRLLRTKILKQLRANDWNSFGITAPTRGAGKTMVSVNLAIAMAMEVNQTILLVDLDLRYPKVHTYFNLKIEKGLKDYLVSDIPLTDVLINPSIERLSLLPGKGQVIASSELLTAPKMREMVDDIKQRYQARIVIFDLPPVLACDDVLSCMDFFDALLLVVENGGNTPEEVTKSLQMLRGVNLLGTVLNKAEKIPEHIGYYK